MSPLDGRNRDRIKGSIQRKLESALGPGQTVTAPPPHRPGDGFRALWLLICKWAFVAWHYTPMDFWGQPGILWGGTVMPESWDRFFNQFDADKPKREPGYIRAPLGGVIESIFRRFRRCITCGKVFGRKGWWNPLCGVNIFEEHCSGECAEAGKASL